MDKATLLKKKQEIGQQQKLAEANFHRLSGALVLIEEMLVELDKPKEEPKKDESKSE